MSSDPFQRLLNNIITNLCAYYVMVVFLRFQSGDQDYLVVDQREAMNDVKDQLVAVIGSRTIQEYSLRGLPKPAGYEFQY